MQFIFILRICVHIKYYIVIGCFKEVWINHKPLDFTNAARQVRVRPGCAQQDEPDIDQTPAVPAMLGDPTNTQVFFNKHKNRHYLLYYNYKIFFKDACTPNPCKRGGKCVQEGDSKSDYSCKCKPGTRGLHCEMLASIGKFLK